MHNIFHHEIRLHLHGDRELRIRWTNGNYTYSHFTVLMREVVLADHVEAQVMDVTSLLISQAQHFGADMREHDSQLIQAQQMQESAKKSLREFEKNEKTDYKTVVEAGFALTSCSRERW
jgi:hypothetical protein